MPQICTDVLSRQVLGILGESACFAAISNDKVPNNYGEIPDGLAG